VPVSDMRALPGLKLAVQVADKALGLQSCRRHLRSSSVGASRGLCVMAVTLGASRID